MADEILQSLGFDASAALDALAKMDKALIDFESRLGSLGGAMQTWNGQAGGTVTALKDIATSAKDAAAAMEKLRGAFNAPQAKPGGGQQSSEAKEAARIIAETRTPQEKYAASMEKLKALSQSGAIDQMTYARAVEQAGQKLQDADRAAAKFVVSWETMSRVVMTQAIVRAMSAVRDAMSEALESNLKFMTSVAEIQSVSTGAGSSIDEIAQHLAGLSRAFNIPLAQVAEAQYQTLSNQFTRTAEQSDVLSAAFKLSKVAVMDAGAAVNLVAGTLNAYGLASTEAESVAAKLFATIQIGRVRGEELASVLGKVTAVSSELGVGLEDLSAMMVTLTVSGVKPAEAATSLRSMMMALIKPSQDLAKELRLLGFESGAEMIAAYGLEGTMLRLRESTDENIAAFAKLIPNVRAISGALRETADDGKKTADAMQHLRETTVATFNAKYKLFIESDAQKVLAEMNKLHVFLTTDLGASLVSAANKFMGFAGGADAIAAAIKAMIPVLGVAVTAFGSYALVLGTVAMNAKLAASSLSLVGASVSGLMQAMAVYAAYDFTNNRVLQILKDVEEAFHKNTQASIDAAAAATTARLEEEDRLNRGIVERVNQAVAEQRKAYFAAVDAAKDADKELIANSHDTMGKIVEGAEKQVHALRDVAKEADRAIDDSLKKSHEMLGGLEDRQFRFKEAHEVVGQSGNQLLVRSDWQKQQDDLDRAKKLADEAAKQMAKAKTAQDIAEAESRFKRSETFAAEHLQIVERLGSGYQLADAEQAVERILEQEIEAQAKLRAAKQEQARAASLAAAEEESHITLMREAMKAYLKDSELFDKKGNPLTGEDRAKAVARSQADLDKFRDEMLASGKVPIGDMLQYDSLRRKLHEAVAGSVTEAEVTKLFTPPKTLSDLNKQITDGVGAIDVSPYVKDPSKLKGMTAEQQLRQGEADAKAQREEALLLGQARRDEDKALQTILRDNLQITAAMQVQKGAALGWLQFFKDATPFTASFAEIKAAKSELDAINEAINQLRASPQAIDPKEMTALTERVKGFKETAPWSMDVQTQSLERNLATLKEIFDTAQSIQGIEAKFPDLNRQIQRSQEGMERLNQAAPGQDETKAINDLIQKTEDAGKAADNLSLSRFITQIADATEQIQRMGQALAAVPGSGGGRLTAAHGGMAFLAGGGSPRGTDVIPAMLSPGEIVMSAAATRRFASQLTAMNAGVRPSYHSQGGSVTNIGDINVSVHGGESGRQTGRAIAGEIRRELRRGTSIL